MHTDPKQKQCPSHVSEFISTGECIWFRSRQPRKLAPLLGAEPLFWRVSQNRCPRCRLWSPDRRQAGQGWQDLRISWKVNVGTRCNQVDLLMNKTTHYPLDTLFVPVISDQEVMFHDLITILACPDWMGFCAALPPHPPTWWFWDETMNCAVPCRPTSTRKRNLKRDAEISLPLDSLPHVITFC